jgi:hypothetical protein
MARALAEMGWEMLVQVTQNTPPSSNLFARQASPSWPEMAQGRQTSDPIILSLFVIVSLFMSLAMPATTTTAEQLPGTDTQPNTTNSANASTASWMLEGLAVRMVRWLGV